MHCPFPARCSFVSIRKRDRPARRGKSPHTDNFLLSGCTLKWKAALAHTLRHLVPNGFVSAPSRAHGQRGEGGGYRILILGRFSESIYAVRKYACVDEEVCVHNPLDREEVCVPESAETLGLWII
jgi:hypothetical protein